jgi:tRNA modification GTPase
MNQMRGGFTHEIALLRGQLVDFASLLELELDFSEEDVAFADRDSLLSLLQQLLKAVNQLKSSFLLGNVIKQGVATVIAGKPNAGKSTLLNALLNEEKAIVSHIPGTTRDVIEDVISLQGVKFRFYDTAGIREATDMIESIGVSRTFEKLEQAAIIIYLFDLQHETPAQLEAALQEVPVKNARLLLVGNKVDSVDAAAVQQAFAAFPNMLLLSAKEKAGIDALQEKLLQLANLHQLQNETVVANARHYEALGKAAIALEAAHAGLNNQLPTDLVAQEIRQCLHYLGEITGEISTDDLLGNIFSKFCIGK